MTHQEKLQTAMNYAFAHRPAIGGFPFLAECIRQAGVLQNIWILPQAESTYVFFDDTLVMPGTPVAGIDTPAPVFNKEMLVAAIRADQAGQTTFPEFLQHAWNAGVVKYIVDFSLRTVTYIGAAGEIYTEEYAPVLIETIPFV